MIDIICVAYNNYNLMDKVLSHMKEWVRGDYRLFIADNSSNFDESRMNNFKNINDKVVDVFVPSIPDYMRQPSHTPGQRSIYDGLSHGLVLDELKAKTESEIVGTLDQDFFWINPDIISYTEQRFAEGYSAVGCAGWYNDWQRLIDPIHPTRAGHLAPAVWGQFISREVAFAETFSVTLEEMPRYHETGWRVRKYLIDNKLKQDIFPGFFHKWMDDGYTCFFGTEEAPMGVHLLKGTTPQLRPVPDLEVVGAMLERLKLLWI